MIGEGRGRATGQVVSARVVGQGVGPWRAGRLTGFGSRTFSAQLGDDLVFEVPADKGLSGSTLKAVRLRPDGTFGPPTDRVARLLPPRRAARWSSSFRIGRCS